MNLNDFYFYSLYTQGDVMMLSSNLGLLYHNLKKDKFYLIGTEQDLPKGFGHVIKFRMEYYIHQNISFIHTSCIGKKTFDQHVFNKPNYNLDYNNVSPRTHIWNCIPGKYDTTTRGRYDGGVKYRNMYSNNEKTYTTKDGLADDNCQLMKTTKQGLWVSHYDSEKGLSFFDFDTKKWKVVKQSENGISLGGDKLYSTGKYLWIVSDERLVRLNTETLNADEYTEQNGLPGNKIDRTHIGPSNFWVITSTRENNNDISRVGFAKFPLH